MGNAGGQGPHRGQSGRVHDLITSLHQLLVGAVQRLDVLRQQRLIRNQAIRHGVHALAELLELQALRLPDAVPVLPLGNATGVLGQLLQGRHQEPSE